MNKLTSLTSQPIALAAAIALAVAAVTALTTPTPTPTAEPSGDTATPGPTIPAAQYNAICSLVGSVPGDPAPQRNCTRIPVTVTAAYTQVTPR